MTRARLSAVLPALNEEANLAAAVTRLVDVLRSLPLDGWEIIVVDDGSADRTAEIVAELVRAHADHVRSIHHRTSRGYAGALKAGFAAARYELVFYTDADNQFDVRDLAVLLPLIADADIVCGYRIARSDPVARRILSRGFNLLVRISFGLRIRDVNCAFKLFRREVFEQISIESKMFFVDAEVLAKASDCRLRVVQVGVQHFRRTGGLSKVRLADAYTTLADLVRTWFVIRTRAGSQQAGR